MRFDWSIESREARLTKLWSEGVPLVVIAAALGCTRNAVIGKAHRLKLPTHPHATTPATSDRPQTPRRMKTSTLQVRHLNRERGDHAVPFAIRGGFEAPRLGRGKCQWIEGEPSADDACKCGAQAIEGRPYCPEHFARAYVPRKPKAEAA